MTANLGRGGGHFLLLICRNRPTMPMITREYVNNSLYVTIAIPPFRGKGSPLKLGANRLPFVQRPAPVPGGIFILPGAPLPVNCRRKKLHSAPSGYSPDVRPLRSSSSPYRNRFRWIAIRFFLSVLSQAPFAACTAARQAQWSRSTLRTSKAVKAFRFRG